MEEMNARVMENEVMDETVEVDEAVDSGNAGALVAGIVGGFLAYAVIGGAKKLWGFAGAKLAERKAARDEVKITVNEFLMEIGLEPCDDSIGETMGWDIDKGYIELDFSSQLVDGVPYLVLGHRVPPVYLGW